MTALSIILNIVLILVALVLIVAVLMQQGQRQGLGAIAGGADTFFGKNKAMGLDAKLQKITKIVAVAFIVLSLATTMVVSHNNEGAELSLTDEEYQAMLDELIASGELEVMGNVDPVTGEVVGETHDDHVHNADGTITDLEGNVITEEEAHGTVEATEAPVEATEAPAAVEATEAPAAVEATDAPAAAPAA